ncbi:unnamed protein product [Symbiodinium natans]|uniref:Transmembrane protein n=1 Tax=Symbiodinium natans TaxID=878477 RepID=A0A812S0Z0_9DINO|nr:unnamed protein product [Symbiodinium natans]
MSQRLRRVDSFDDIKRAGLFRGVSILNVLYSQAVIFASGLAGVIGAAAEGRSSLRSADDSDRGAIDAMFESTSPADRVDYFISHTWSSDRWTKYLALCLHLNLRLAVFSSILTWILTATALVLWAGSLGAWGGSRLLLPSLVYWPMAIFYLVFFYGHLLSRHWQKLPTVWLDKMCIHQGDEAMKAQQVTALPVFVACSSRILVLWDDTYFERLWCNLELATFAKYGSAERVEIRPLWLAPWLLWSMLLDLASASFFEVCEVAFPNWSMDLVKDLVDFFENTFQLGEASPQGLVIACMAIWTMSGACYLPTSVPAFLAFRQKIANHHLMLEQMSQFDLRRAKCTIEADRKLVESQVEELFSEKGTDRLPAWDDSDELLREGDMVVKVHLHDRVTWSERQHSTEQALDKFNAYVRGPLQDTVRDTIGDETHVPYYLCMVAYLPMGFYSLVNVLGCDNGPCEKSFVEGGYSSFASYMLTQVVAWILCMLLSFPITHPVLLRLMHVTMSRTNGCLQFLLATLCCPLAYAYTYMCLGLQCR